MHKNSALISFINSKNLISINAVAAVYVSAVSSSISNSLLIIKSTVSLLSTRPSILASFVSVSSIWVSFLSSPSVLFSSISILKREKTFLSSGKALLLTSGWLSILYSFPFLLSFYLLFVSVLLPSSRPKQMKQPQWMSSLLF